MHPIMTTPSCDCHAALMSLAGRLWIRAGHHQERIARRVVGGVHIKRSPMIGKAIPMWSGRDLASEHRRGVAVSRILVVDDEQRICRFVARAMGANGFQIQLSVTC